MTDFDAARAKMVESQLLTENVTDRRLIAAMRKVPREAFLPERLRPIAYIDRDLLLAEATADAPARYLLEPAPFARLVQSVQIDRGDCVLDLGCGTGYSAAVLAELAESVVAMESDEGLSATASEILTELEVDNAAVVTGDLEKGYPDEAPYDVIVLEGAVDFVPEALLAQLRDGGRLVCVIGRGRAADATVFIKADGETGTDVVFDTDVPPLPGFARPPAFVF